MQHFTCEQCGAVFERRWRRDFVQRFCSVICRNRYLAATYSALPEDKRKFKTCPKCGHVGYRAEPLCTRCGGCSRLGRKYRRKPGNDLLWTAEQVAYLREHYATDGAAETAAALGYSLSAVRCKANKLGLHLTPQARHRVIHAAARAHMTYHNPMHRAEVVAKQRAWREAHPEEVAAHMARLQAGHQRIERDKPSKLERRLRDILTEFGVPFEPSVLIKDKFVVDIRIGTLIIQADGDYWHGHPRFATLTPRQAAQQRRDRSHDADLTACGYTVVRIWESEMTREKVAAVLRAHDLIPAA